MKIMTKFKGTLKDSYRTIKKSVQKMFKNLGLNKKETQKATLRTLNVVELQISQFLNDEMQKTFLAKPFPNDHVKGSNNEQERTKKYQEMLIELNSLFAKEKQTSFKEPGLQTKVHYNQTREAENDESYSK